MMTRTLRAKNVFILFDDVTGLMQHKSGGMLLRHHEAVLESCYACMVACDTNASATGSERVLMHGRKCGADE